MHFKLEPHRIAWRCAGVLALAPWAAVAAQPAAAGGVASIRRTCEGDTVTSIDVRAYPPSTAGLSAASRQAAARVLRRPHETTRSEVIRAYLRVAVGQVCTERDRRESERLLRAQPFLAAAAVRAIPESPGHVRLQVDVIDEVRPMTGARVSRGTLSSLLLGTQNLAGRGLLLSAHAERGFAYRDGFGLRAVKYGMFGRPDYLALHAQRNAVDG